MQSFIHSFGYIAALLVVMGLNTAGVILLGRLVLNKLPWKLEEDEHARVSHN